MNGCKKTDKVGNPINTNDPVLEKIAIDRALQNAAAQGQVTTFPINVKAPMFFSDENGNPIKRDTKPFSVLSNGTSCSDYDPYLDAATLVSITRSFLCNSGYKFKVVWEMPMPAYNNLLTANPLNTTIKSLLQMQLRNPGNTIIDQDLAMTNVTLVNTGTWVVDPSYKLWTITAESKSFSVSTVGSATSTWFRYSMYHTCFPNSSATISVGWTAANSTSIAANTQPCTRIDKVFINPPTGAGCTQPPLSGSPSITGCNAVGQCSGTGYILPTTQYVRWRGVDANGNFLTTGTEAVWRYKRMQPSGGPTPYPSIYVFSATPGVDYKKCTRYLFQYVNEYTGTGGCGPYTSATYPATTTGLVGQEYWQF